MTEEVPWLVTSLNLGAGDNTSVTAKFGQDLPVDREATLYHNQCCRRVLLTRRAERLPMINTLGVTAMMAKAQASERDGVF